MMSPRCRFVLTTLLLLSAAALGAREKLDLERLTPAPATAPVPIQDFFRPLLLEWPSLNLSGSHMAALVTVGKDRHDLLVVDLEKKSFETLRTKGEKDIYAFTWLNDQRLVYMLSEDKHYAVGMMALDITHMSGSYSLLQYCGPRLVAVPERNRLRPLVWMSFDGFDDGRDAGVGEINTDVRTTMINLDSANTDGTEIRQQRDNNDRHIVKRWPLPEGIGAGYLGDRQGDLAFAITGNDGYFSLFRWEDGKWLKCPVDLDDITVFRAGDRPGELLVRGPRQEGKPSALQRVDAATGQLGEVLLQDQRYDFYGWPFRDINSLQIVGVRYDRAAPTSVWFDESYRVLQKALDAQFPKQVARIIDVDRSGRLLVGVSSDRQPTIYYWVDLAKHSVGLIKNSAPWIDPARMQPMSVIQFKTRDGRKLDAYVTMPAGASKARPAPLVVLPHGGPWGVRDTWGFDGEVQFLASRGYAVLQPNYRGSPGYDWMFPEGDKYDFLKMHQDVTDATKTLLASGYVDPSRVAIMGGSFGGYLALSGVTHEAGLYRCAVTIAGVFDWETMMGTKKYSQYQDNVYSFYKRRIGDPAKEAEKFADISPLRFVNQVKVPVFVSHGTDDHVAEVGESKRLIAQLEKYNVPHEVLLVSGEGHGMGHLTNQVELYSHIEAFLGKYLAPAPAAAVTPAAAP